jgi:hypothetical protein
MQDVLGASEGDMEKAKAWLADMDPFVVEANELPHDMLPDMYAATNSSTPTSTSSSDVGSRSHKKGPSGEDVYWSHRKGAVQLSRQWRKLFRKCASPSAKLNVCIGRFT